MRWSKKETLVLWNNLSSTNESLSAQLPGRTVAMIAMKRSSLGITTTPGKWSRSEEALVISLHGDIAKLRELLPFRTTDAIRGKIRALRKKRLIK